MMLSLLLSTMLLLLWWGQGAAITIHACESNHIKITCPMPTAQVILIRSAMYGRRTDRRGSQGMCGDNLVIYRRCEADITQYMKYRCEGKPICEVYVDVATFGMEMCVDIKKYAMVDYECVQSFAMERVKQCYNKCVPSAGSVPNAFAMKHTGGSKAQIPGPAPGKNSIGHSSSASAPAPASSSASSSSSASVPSPPRASASSSSSSSKASAPSSQSANPAAPALPYGSLSHSIAGALGGTKSSTSGPAQTPNLRSAVMRAQLLNRLRRVLLAIRNRRRG